MKKIIVLCTLFIMAITINVMAQPSKQMEIHSWSWNATASANQIVQVPGDKGTIRFVKKGDNYSDVVFTDKTGKVNRLSAVNNCSNTTTKTTCEGTTDGCFATQDKKVNIYFCRSAKLSGTTSRQTTITIAL